MSSLIASTIFWDMFFFLTEPRTDWSARLADQRAPLSSRLCLVNAGILCVCQDAYTGKRSKLMLAWQPLYWLSCLPSLHYWLFLGDKHFRWCSFSSDIPLMFNFISFLALEIIFVLFFLWHSSRFLCSSLHKPFLFFFCLKVCLLPSDFSYLQQ